MRPQLMISRLTSLQDARSSAAVGFDLVGFSLTRGDHRKLSVSMAWNIVQWLTGPRIVLEIDSPSLPELEAALAQFPVHHASLPLADAGLTLPAGLGAPILRGDAQAGVDAWAAALADGEPLGELWLPDVPAVQPFGALLPRLLLHFARLEDAVDFLRTAEQLPYGFAFGTEAEEEPGVLDYARIDSFLELFFDRCGTD
ncbi:MAG: hypothetical protein OHK0039_35620 [Bacteroidia bacterium]